MIPEVHLRCRTVRPGGRRCEKAALGGNDRCHTHERDRLHRGDVINAPAVIEISLLDNHAAIQAGFTDVSRALLAGTLDHATARLLIAIFRGASQTLLRPVASKASKEISEPLEPVTEIITTPEGEELAPPMPWNTAEVKKERAWSLSEFLYRSIHPEKADEPLPDEPGIATEETLTITSRDVLNAANAMALSEHRDAPPQSQRKPPQPQPGIIPELSAVTEMEGFP